MYLKFNKEVDVGESDTRLLNALAVLDSINQVNLSTEKYDSVHVIETRTEQNINFFEFNPNNLSVLKWMELGLSKKQAEVIKKYEESGGKFRVKHDVKKMYTISEEMYQKLEPYIQLPDSIKESYYKIRTSQKKTLSSESSDFKTKKWARPKVDINTADSASFTKLYGIGPYFSGKIIAYRKSLGGFYDKYQLTDLWGIEDSLIQELDTQLVMSAINLRKLKINKMNAKELKEHPYVNWNIANSIVSIREKHGKYQSIDGIKKSVLINDSLFKKVKPYLSIEE